MNIGSRIKEKRQECGLTLLEVATKLGVREATMQRYESGTIKNIKYDTMVKLAEILNTTPAYLSGWDEEGNTQVTPPDPDDLMELREELRRNPEKRILFDVTKNATKEEILAVADFFKKLKEND